MPASLRGSHTRPARSRRERHLGGGSDLDLLVELPGATYIKLASLQADLEEALGIPVDVTVRELLNDDVRSRASAEAVPL